MALLLLNAASVKAEAYQRTFAVTKSASVGSSPPEIPITADLQCVCSSRFLVLLPEY